MACCGGERGWPAVVGRGGDLLWWGEGVEANNGQCMYSVFVTE